MEDDGIQPLVLDLGSHMIKFGFSGNDVPSATVHNIVGEINSTNNAMIGKVVNKNYTGYNAEPLRSLLGMSRTILNGFVQDFSKFETILHHTFYNELTIAPEDHTLLLTEHPLNPKQNRENILEIVMETFNIPGVYFGIPGVLSYYANNAVTSGLFLDCGCGVTSLVPVYKGEVLVKGILRQNWAGDVCTERLLQLLQRVNTECIKFDKDILELMTQHRAYIPFSEVSDISYTNSVGESVNLYSESLEPLFTPMVMDCGLLGLHELAFDSIQRCDESTHKELCSRIILSGGGTLIPGFKSRFQKELTQLLPSELSGVTNVVAPPDRKYLTWKGGSILSESDVFKHLLISHEEYNEHGPGIAYMKCPL